MANVRTAKPGEAATPTEDDTDLLAVEVAEPVILQEPERSADAPDAASDQPAQKPPKQSSGFAGFVIGGALLAGAGFGAAKFLYPAPQTADAIAALQVQLDASIAQNAELTAQLQADIAALAAGPAPDANLNDRLAAVEAGTVDLPALTGRVTALEDRLTAIETASVAGTGNPSAALAALGREVSDLKTALAAQIAGGAGATADVAAATKAAQDRLDAAEAAAQAAARFAAFSHLRAAFESGAALDPALQGLTSIGVTVPPALADAKGGIPGLLALQDGFAAPARAALDASIRANMGDGWVDRLTGFLRSQSGARSLTPRDGSDPDAVLSRAEAALRAGQLGQALTELAGLPPVGAEAMAPWVADATRRMVAEAAIADLSATLNGQ